MALGGTDSMQVVLDNVTPPDTTGRFSFLVWTGTHPDSIYALSSQPGLLVYGTPKPISAVKVNNASGVPLLLNQLVTVRGIVTAGNEFGGGPTFIQDNSGGIAIYGSALSRSVRIGDEIMVTGTMQPFNGLCEIVSPILHSILSTGNSVDPLVVTVGQIAHDGTGGVENYEGMLVRLNDVTTSASGTWAYANYSLFGGGDTTQVRIDDSTNIIGTPVPAGAFDLVGVVGQYVTSSPYIGGYQVQPRFTADIFSSGPVISAFPSATGIQPNSLTIAWQTLNGGTSHLYYGKTPSLELGIAGDDQLDTVHTVQLTSLEPATVYYIKVFSSAGSDTSFASVLIACTASPAATTGVINAYFNKSVDQTIAQPTAALGNQDLVARLVTRINNAHRSIDAALYSLSSTPGDAVAYALVNALVRGVKVRVICEYDNRNGSGFSTLSGSGVPLIDDRFDAINGGAGLMHNKFLVIDGRGGAPESVWVWTGSWNPTLAGTVEDYQNSIEIQDAALARAYTLEFEEMWGSSNETPNASTSRFGARKTDNTPHQFVIGGRSVECYFSPSDRTTSHIIAAITRAERSVAVGVMTVTRSDIGSALVARKNSGKKVRVVLDNSSDTGTQFFYLQGQGVDVHIKTGSGTFHHKYMVADGDYPLGTPLTLTGSHNWSNSAENSNNENTLIVRDAALANQYLQEFAARYYQFGGTDTIRTDVRVVDGAVPARYALQQNYPNPFNPSTTIRYQIPAFSRVTLKVYDVLGREVVTLLDAGQGPGTYAVRWDAVGLASGVYLFRLEAGTYREAKRMVLVK
jgi:phosphatidylserine/phosphatidylglycerophosphate/cardiolipin synthase-like enzyme